jgi:MFS transporter, DHA2 family, multidrug resistance protein
LHQNDLSAHLTPATAILQQRSAALGAYLTHQIGAASARGGSFGLLYGSLQQQSVLLSYVDIFRWTAVLAFFCAGVVWLFKKQPKHAPPPPGAH